MIKKEDLHVGDLIMASDWLFIYKVTEVTDTGVIFTRYDRSGTVHEGDWTRFINLYDDGYGLDNRYTKITLEELDNYIQNRIFDIHSKTVGACKQLTNFYKLVEGSNENSNEHLI